MRYLFKFLSVFIISIGFFCAPTYVRASEEFDIDKLFEDLKLDLPEEEIKKDDKIEEPTTKVEKEETKKIIFDDDDEDDDADTDIKGEKSFEIVPEKVEKIKRTVRLSEDKAADTKEDEVSSDDASKETDTQEGEILTEEAGTTDEKIAEETVQEIPETTPLTETPVQEADKSAEKVGLSEQQAGAEETGLINIDTINLSEPRGNWLIKRYWLQRAEKVYEQINALVDQVSHSFMSFTSDRNELDGGVLDPFYLEVGMDQGELIESVSSLIKEMEKERKEEGDLSSEEREFLDKLVEEKGTIDQLREAIESISEIDSSVENAFDILKERLTLARDYEKQAHAKLVAISQELSDNQARNLYFGMHGLLKNIQDIEQYIDGSFRPHFDKSLQNIRESIDRVKTTLEALKQSGIKLQNEAEKLEKQEKAEKAAAAAAAAKKPAKKEATGFGAMLSNMWNYITSFFMSEKVEEAAPTEIQPPAEIETEQKTTPPVVEEVATDQEIQTEAAPIEIQPPTEVETEQETTPPVAEEVATDQEVQTEVAPIEIQPPAEIETEQKTTPPVVEEVATDQEVQTDAAREDQEPIEGEIGDEGQPEVQPLTDFTESATPTSSE